MKKIIVTFLLLQLFQVTGYTQTKSLVKELSKTKELKFSSKVTLGKNGASVAWHPIQKKYYTTFAGNGTYPLAVFNAAGKLLSSDTCTAQFDTRGLWYNKTTKQIEGNAYNNVGWFKYAINKKGLVSKIEMLYAKQKQPDAQSTGAYIEAYDKVLFCDVDIVVMYASVNPKERVDDVLLYLGCAKEPAEGTYDAFEAVLKYQPNTLISTGISNAEIGLLNIVDETIELYSSATGLLTQTLALPKGIVLPEAFGFAFANNTYWIFDTTNRKWVGYQ